MNHERQLFFLPCLILLTLVLLSSRAEAANYTVKAGGGGNYTTISACANAAGAGDTCLVFAGSYGGWTQSANGSAGKPITFQANAGDSVSITSGISISSRSYITIQGFKFTSSAHVTGNGSTQHCIIDGNTMAGTHVFQINDGLGSGGSDNVFSNNIVNVGSISSNQGGGVCVWRP